MEQLIITYSYLGEWHRKYYHSRPKKYSSISIPYSLRGKDKIIGVTVDNRAKWRERLESITKNASYEIIVKD